MTEIPIDTFSWPCHVLAGDLLLIDHLGPLLSVSFLPDVELSNHFVQLLEILARLLGSFFVELTDDIFQCFNGVLELFSATVLPNSSNERVSIARRLLLS